MPDWLLLTAAPLAAQQQAIATRVAGQLGGKFTDASRCKLEGGRLPCEQRQDQTETAIPRPRTR